MKRIAIYIVAFIFLSCSKKYEFNPKYEQIELPHIYINIENNQEVVEKSLYLNGNISIDNSDFNIVDVGTRIRGRGNTTWRYPKKPYRLKLDKAQSILGLKPAKDWVLLANYQDETLMMNAVSMEIGKLLNMPYVNTIIPVDLTINGKFRGSYNLTEQVEVHESRLNITDGVLLELDNNLDEDWQFVSKHYNLPVMVKYPKLEPGNTKITNIISDFEELENNVKNGNNDLIDIQSLVNFLIVQNLTLNKEINYPRSVYVYKEDGGKYNFGPIWDFDSAFGYNHSIRNHFVLDGALLEYENNNYGALFFNQLLQNKEIKKAYIKTWDDFYANKFHLLLNFIDIYSHNIAYSNHKDYKLWEYSGRDIFNSHVNNLKAFLIKRAKYINDEYTFSNN